MPSGHIFRTAGAEGMFAPVPLQKLRAVVSATGCESVRSVRRTEPCEPVGVPRMHNHFLFRGARSQPLGGRAGLSTETAPEAVSDQVCGLFLGSSCVDELSSAELVSRQELS